MDYNKNYSVQENIDMIWILGECQKNAFLASRVYRQRYPERRHPQKDTFENLKNRFDRTGTVKYEKHSRDATAVTVDNEYKVMISIVEDPNVSTRQLSNQLDISNTTIRRIIKKNKYHPYHIQLHQELLPRDFARREEYCRWLINKINTERNFLNKVLFSDEATFHKNGCVNRHNFHYYSDHNEHLFRTTSQYRWSLNVWAGIIGDYVIGPYFFDGTVNGAAFLNFLELDFRNLLQNVPQNYRNGMWFQLDGATPHYQLNVRNWLNREFQDRWIGRAGPTNWPARSPGLTPCDFFLWGFIKNIVYKEEVTTKQNMKDRITAAFRQVTPAMLRDVRKSMKERARKCINENGRHFEHLL